MIQKTYRLKEREVKKVLAKGKPFFSYMIVLNSIPNNCGYHRFGVIISQKSLPNSVTRNFFRRKFYATLQINQFISNSQNNELNLQNQCFDFVCVVKKQITLKKNDSSIVEEFEKNISFLFTKVLKIGKKSLI